MMKFQKKALLHASGDKWWNGLQTKGMDLSNPTCLDSTISLYIFHKWRKKQKLHADVLCHTAPNSIPSKKVTPRLLLKCYPKKNTKPQDRNPYDDRDKRVYDDRDHTYGHGRPNRPTYHTGCTCCLIFSYA